MLRTNYASLNSPTCIAICSGSSLSEGQVNIFNLAKNAGTSVDQYRALLCPSPNALLYLIHAVSARGACIIVEPLQGVTFVIF